MASQFARPSLARAASTAPVMGPTASRMEQKQPPQQQPPASLQSLSTDDAATAAAMVGATRRMPMARRRRTGTSYVHTSTKPFSMSQGGTKGGKTIRNYEFSFKLSQTNSIFQSTALSIGVRHVPITGFTMTIYAGLGTHLFGTPLQSHPDFPTEAGHLFDLFKWFTLKKMEVQIIPIINSVDTASSNAAAQTNQSDPGRLGLFNWDGNADYADASTGAMIARTATDIWRLPHKSTRAIGGKPITMAYVPVTPVLDQASNGVFKPQRYPRSVPIDTAQMVIGDNEYPYYGFGYIWDHPNYNGIDASAKWVILKVRVQCQWNTIKDTFVSTTTLQQERKLYEDILALAGQPTEFSVDDKPVLYRKDIQVPQLEEIQQQEELLKQKEQADLAKIKEDYVTVNTPANTPRK